MPGIESISGSIKGANGSRIIFKTYSRPSVNRKGKTETRVYISHKQTRKKPLSEREHETRHKFTLAAEYYRNLSNEQRQNYREDYVRSNFLFNGKRYTTLKGYIMARYYAEHLSNDTK